MTITTTVQIWREGDQFVAHAMPIDIASCGDTADSARKAVDEAVRLFFQAAKEQGTMDQVLDECGYQRLGDAWVSPEFISIERHALAV